MRRDISMTDLEKYIIARWTYSLGVEWISNSEYTLLHNLMKEKYSEGKANATEYNESRTAWMKAVSEKIQAKYDYIFRTKILDFYRGVPLSLK